MRIDMPGSSREEEEEPALEPCRDSCLRIDPSLLLPAVGLAKWSSASAAATACGGEGGETSGPSLGLLSQPSPLLHTRVSPASELPPILAPSSPQAVPAAVSSSAAGGVSSRRCPNTGRLAGCSGGVLCVVCREECQQSPPPSRWLHGWLLIRPTPTNASSLNTSNRHGPCGGCRPVAARFL